MMSEKPDLDEAPEIITRKYRVYEVTTAKTNGALERSRHIVAALVDDTVRVSSNIVTFDKDQGRVTTHTGRVYVLGTGKIGQTAKSADIWWQWVQIHGAKEIWDVSGDYEII